LRPQGNAGPPRRLPSARLSSAKYFSVPVAAFNTSNTPKATAWKCSKPYASLA